MVGEDYPIRCKPLKFPPTTNKKPPRAQILSHRLTVTGTNHTIALLRGSVLVFYTGSNLNTPDNAEVISKREVFSQILFYLSSSSRQIKMTLARSRYPPQARTELRAL